MKHLKNTHKMCTGNKRFVKLLVPTNIKFIGHLYIKSIMISYFLSTQVWKPKIVRLYKSVV